MAAMNAVAQTSFFLLIIGATSTDPDGYFSLLQARAKHTSRAIHDTSVEAPPTLLSLSNLIQNNLVGQGPDSGAVEMRFGSAAHIDGTVVDLVITAMHGFEQAAEQSTLNGIVNSAAVAKIGKINQAPGSSNSFVFTLVEHLTMTPVTLDKFALTFIDIDGNAYQDLKETLHVCGAHAFGLSDSTRIDHQVDEGCFSFTPSIFTGAQNPKDPASLTPTQLNHAVTLWFTETSSFQVTSSLTCTKKRSTRPLLFAGIAPLLVTQVPTPDPTPVPTLMPTSSQTPVPTPAPTVSPIGTCVNTEVFVTSYRNQQLEDRMGQEGLHADKTKWQEWTVTDAGAGKIFLTSHLGKQLEDRGGELGLHAGKGDWQKWTVTDAGAGKIFLTSHLGQQLEDRAGELGLHADSDDWQKWTVTRASDGGMCNLP